MTNEEFQKIVLEELRGLKEGQEQLVSRMEQLETGQEQLVGRMERLETGQEQLVGRIERLEIGQKQLEVGQGEIRKDIKSIIEQTADLTEFRQETNEKLDSLMEDNKSICQILGEHEVSIRTVRRKII
ncbi:MAG: hypothetical protein GX023_04140 [Tissierellia bacterium]|nr:hypothetical protein [Tissierellia bacterium]